MITIAESVRSIVAVLNWRTVNYVNQDTVSSVENLRRTFSSHVHNVVENYAYIVVTYTRMIMESATNVIIVVIYKSNNK